MGIIEKIFWPQKVEKISSDDLIKRLKEELRLRIARDEVGEIKPSTVQKIIDAINATMVWADFTFNMGSRDKLLILILEDYAAQGEEFWSDNPTR